MKNFIKWYRKHYGTNRWPIIYLIAIPTFSILFGLAAGWKFGAGFFVIVAAIFWFNRNTK